MQGYLGGRTDRRKFIRRIARLGATSGGLVLLGGCSLVLPGQTPVRRIGFVVGENRASIQDELVAFLDALRQVGWVEGRNLTIEWREAGGSFDLYQELPVELSHLGVEIIVVANSSSLAGAAAATSAIPIVAIGGATRSGSQSPVALGYVASLARPGGNITGVITQDLVEKRMELLRSVFPKLVRVGMLHSETRMPAAKQSIADAEAVARRLGMEPVDMEVSAITQEVAPVFERATAAAVEAVAQPSGWVVLNGQAQRVAELALNARLPSIFPARKFVDASGLMSYADSTTNLYRRGATYVDRILRGAKPGDLPIELPTKYEFTANTTTAEVLGVTLPADVVSQVTEWVS